jgi:hypothetical protein
MRNFSNFHVPFNLLPMNYAAESLREEVPEGPEGKMAPVSPATTQLHPPVAAGILPPQRMYQTPEVLQDSY